MRTPPPPGHAPPPSGQRSSPDPRNGILTRATHALPRDEQCVEEVALRTRLYMLMRARAGVTALEYGLIAALLAGILVSVVTHFATDITALFTLPTPIATSG